MDDIKNGTISINILKNKLLSHNETNTNRFSNFANKQSPSLINTNNYSEYSYMPNNKINESIIGFDNSINQSQILKNNNFDQSTN